MQPFLIGNYGTGLYQSLEPWLFPRDAWTRLENGQVYKGELRPRKGLSTLGKLKCLQAVVVGTNTDTLPAVALAGLTIPATGFILITDGSEKFFVYIDENDNFTGNITGATAIDRGAGTISFTWDDPAATDQPNIYYQDTPCDDPVMGLFNFNANDGTKTSIAMNTDYVNRFFNISQNYIPLAFSTAASSNAGFSGDGTNFFSATMYPDGSNNPRLIFVNGVDRPQFYRPSTSVTTVYDYTDSTADNTEYTAPSGGTITTALHVFWFGDRIMFLRPTLGTTEYPVSYLYSAITDSSGFRDNFNAPGAGFQDLYDDTRIIAATQMGDRIIIATEANFWEITYTNNFDLPFRHRRIMQSDFSMSTGPYSMVNWLNNSVSLGFWGLFKTDGRAGMRFDQKIPFFTREEINSEGVKISNAGVIQPSAQIWWTYMSLNAPSMDDNELFADQVLAWNYEEDSFAQYSLDLTTFGYYRNQDFIPWDDVTDTVYPDRPDWAQWDTTEDIWNSFSWGDESFSPIAGDKKGFVYLVENQDALDYAENITGITAANPAVITLENSRSIQVGDTITINDVTGYEVGGESLVNGNMYDVIAVSGNNITINLDGQDASAYTSDGYIGLAYSFLAQTKPLNPFAEGNKRCRFHKVWFYVSTSTDNFLIDFFADDREDPYKSNVILDCSDSRGEATRKWVPISVNQTGSFHRIRIRQEEFSSPGKIHGMMLLMSPTGRLY